MRIEGLHFDYGGPAVLQDVSVVARAGCITAVLGPNAAGKSTLLRCTIGVLRPGRGRVEIAGRPAHRLSARELARRVAYVPQRSTVSASFSVREVVTLGRYALPADSSRVEQALAALDLLDLADRPYPALSTGQQQRVTLARAVAQLEPAGLLVLDEPMSAMDLTHVRLCSSLLRELADTGVTILLALHDLPLAADLADEAWLLASGRIAAAGPVDEVMTPRRLESVFGVPFLRLPVDDRMQLVARLL
jgi:iron complex transport system ATP-binding protein